MQPLEKQLRSFIVENFLFGEDPGLALEDSFLDRGIIDSTGVLELVLYLETTFGFTVEDNEVVPENLDSIGRLTHYVNRKLEAASWQDSELAQRATPGQANWRLS